MSNLVSAIPVALSGFVIVFMVLMTLWGIVGLLTKMISGLAKPQAVVSATASAKAEPALAAPIAKGSAVELIGVDELSAACVMAIVSHETGISLDELTFHSIKAV